LQDRGNIYNPATNGNIRQGFLRETINAFKVRIKKIEKELKRQKKSTPLRFYEFL
jgi:hypothetical protein